MKGRWVRIAAVLFLVGFAFSAAVVHGEDASYWNRFKSIFVDWDDNAKPGTAKTATVGVRGMNVEEALGDEKYDWKSVEFMEKFPVDIKTQKSFLRSEKLGPFQEG